jgi:hypothetical protein
VRQLRVSYFILQFDAEILLQEGFGCGVAEDSLTKIKRRRKVLLKSVKRPFFKGKDDAN